MNACASLCLPLPESISGLCVAPSEGEVISRIMDADKWFVSATEMQKALPSLAGMCVSQHVSLPPIMHLVTARAPAHCTSQRSIDKVETVVSLR